MEPLDMITVTHVYLALMRYIGPVLVLLVLLRCVLPLLTFRREPEIWAWLVTEEGKRLPITHWENVIGRSKRCDVVLEDPAVSRNHAVLTRYDDGSWTISDADSKNGITVNHEIQDIREVVEGDLIGIGEALLRFLPVTREQEQTLASLRTRAAGVWGSFFTLLLLTLFQLFTCLGFVLSRPEAAQNAVVGFGGIAVLQWLLLIFNYAIRRPAFEVETLAFLLCSLGMSVICTVTAREAGKQLMAIALGMIAFLTTGWSLRDLQRAKRIRYGAAVVGMALLIVTLLFGEEYYGAKNWLNIGGLSVQPSEFTKLCFVFVGASTMDRLMHKRNLILFIAYTVALCGFLALMNDFGTALVFFTAFLIIAYLRSGSFGTVALACTSLGFAGVIGLKIAPHALRRITAWRHIWEDPLGAGYQQTQALMGIASGGLFGLGIGQGKLRKLFAADSDMVFATVSEEWGLVMAVISVLAVVALGLFVLRCCKVSRSSFYTIGSCTAAAILLVQTVFNVLGTLDVLPLTGVTFPFLSNGGSSMISVWGLLAFIKAADTRANGSFAVRLHRKGRNHA
ncbi:MAG: FHA domain-containing protein [Ruminococcaceae bacterium]|nr:FHA domain-containing protein [Oscillospiraceae bacterium]